MTKGLRKTFMYNIVVFHFILSSCILKHKNNIKYNAWEYMRLDYVVYTV